MALEAYPTRLARIACWPPWPWTAFHATLPTLAGAWSWTTCLTTVANGSRPTTLASCAGRGVTGQWPLWEPLTHTVEVVYRSTLSKRHLLWNWRRQMIAAGGHLNAIAANGRQLASQTCEDVQRMSQWLLLRCWKMQMQHDTNEEGVPRCPGATCATWRPGTRCVSEGCPARRARSQNRW